VFPATGDYSQQQIVQVQPGPVLAVLERMLD
jgi:hypothetical protein